MEEIFAAYQAGYQSPSSPPEQQQEAMDYIAQWLKTDDSFAQMVEFLQQNNEGSFITFIFTLMPRWLKYRVSEIPPELLVALKDIIFDQSFEAKFASANNFPKNLAHIRVCVMWQMYPEGWPSFWDDFLPNFSNNSVILFLQEFADFSQGFMSQENKNRYTIIKDAMRADESDAKLIQFILQNLNPQVKTCYNILGAIMKWINLQFIINEDALGVINQGLEGTQEVVGEVLSIFRTIIKRGMPDQNRIEIMQAINVSAISEKVLGTEGIKSETVEKLAALIEAFGTYAIEYQIADGYLELGVHFIQGIIDDKGCVAIAPFIDEYVKADPSVAATILEMLVTRLGYYFNEEDLDPLDEPSILESLTKISKTCLSKNEEDTIGFFSASWEQIDFSEPALVASLLFFSTRTFSNKKFMEQRKAIVEKFWPIISDISEIDSPQIFKIYQLFTSFFNTIAPEYDSEVRTAVYNSMFTMSLAEFEDVNWHNMLMDNFAFFVKNYCSKVEFDPDNIQTLLQAMEPTSVAIAGMLVRLLKDQQEEFFTACMDALNQTLQSEEDKTAVCKLILQFIRSITYSPGSAHIAPVTEFLKSIIEYVSGDDETFSHYIRTVYASLEHEGLEILYETMGVDKGVHSYEELSCAFKALLNSKVYTDHSWAKEIIPALVEPSIELYNSVSPLDWDQEKLGFKNQEIVEMISSFLELISRAIGPELAKEELVDGEIINTVNNFVHTALTNQYEHPSVVAPMIGYVRSVLPLNPEELIPAFIEPTLSFLNTRRFDPANKEWSPVVKVIIELHHEVHTMSEGGADDLIRQYFLHLLPEEGELIESYITDLGASTEELLDRHRRKNGKMFFLKVAQILNSLDK